MLFLYGVSIYSFFFFFFQAEDGIRDLTVTGVQTCALPISWQLKRKQDESMREEKVLSAHPVSDAMRATVLANLVEVERRHEVTVLFACESGSRGWGFASPDSDYDVQANRSEEHTSELQSQSNLVCRLLL